MNLTPFALLSIAPAAKLATHGVLQLANQGRDFASHLLNPPSKAEVQTSVEADKFVKNDRLEQLLAPLKSFLSSRGFTNEDRLELVSDGSESISVEAEPFWHEEVAEWLRENPEWKQAWQEATRHQLKGNLPPATNSGRFLDLATDEIGSHQPTLRRRVELNPAT